MSPRRDPPIIPSQHMSVGGNHGQHPESSDFPYPELYQLDGPTAGSPPSAQNLSHQMRDAPYFDHLLPTDAQTPWTFLDDVEDNHSENVFTPNEDRVWDNQHHNLPPAIGNQHQPDLEDWSQYSPEDMDNEDSEAKAERRKRRGKPKFDSELTKRLAAVPGGAGSNRGVRGQVQENESGLLKYWNEKDRAWIPAVYHCKIRDKLIEKAKTCDTDVYRHPRARGEHVLDITAFLISQKDWDLERDNGWTNIPHGVLYMFAKLNHETPTYEVSWMYYEGCVVLDLDRHPVKDYRDIPLTCSSKIEGALMEAIRRLDSRITTQDFWARLPEVCAKGNILKPQTLNERMTRFRLENSCPAWTERKGTINLRQYLWNRMTPAARAANSTRELSKLSKEEQKEAQSLNAGKHDANAGGWARTKEGKNVTEKEVLASANIQEEGATMPASSRSLKNKRLQQDFNDDYNGNKDNQPQSFASEQGSHTNPSKRRKVRGPTPRQTSLFDDGEEDIFSTSELFVSTMANGTSSREIHPPNQVDFRSILPRNEVEMRDIQGALALTKANYHARIGSECAPTDEHQSYFYQVNEVLHSFAVHWGNPFSRPDLVTSREPWRNGFKNWTIPTGGDQAFLDEQILGQGGGVNFEGP